jgi:NAD(P)-dependent dehydrogenase (short-subunit alcohol dehydrogenase family)
VCPPKQKMLKNLVTLVSGAAQGIGKATAKEFCKQGARALVACDLNLKRLEDTCNEISKEFKDVKIIPLKVDVSNKSDVENMVNTAVKNFKQLDVAFNNAGIAYAEDEMKPFHKQPLSVHEKVLAVNLMGVLYAMHYEVNQMLSQPKGDYSIVNTASIMGAHV